VTDGTGGDRLQQLGRFGLRALRIAASTVSLIELLRSEWTGGIAAGVAWLVFVQVERRVLPPVEQPQPQEQPSPAEQPTQRP
jgi:hypothetical protein